MTAIQEAVESLEDLLSDFSSEEISWVTKALKGLKQTEETSPQLELVQVLAGRSYSPAEKLKLELESLFHYFERRRELLAGALTASEVASLLGTSRQTPHDRMTSQTLLGVLDKGVYRFPVWQFDPSGPDGVIEGLPDVLKALKVSDFAKLNWLMRSNPNLENLTPLFVLKEGDQERVIQEAMTVGVSL